MKELVSTLVGVYPLPNTETGSKSSAFANAQLKLVTTNPASQGTDVEPAYALQGNVSLYSDEASAK